MKGFGYAVLVAVALTATTDRVAAITTYSTTVRRTPATATCKIIKATAIVQQHRALVLPTDVVEERTQCQNRVSLAVEDDPGADELLVVFGGSAAAVDQRLTERCANGLVPVVASVPTIVTPTRSLRGLQTATVASSPVPALAPVVQQIVRSGNPSNRIDVVFMGDGYTASEQSKFFGDIQRLTTDMFTGDTFAQYLPLFNIWAAFVPSVESGIGVGGTPKNTAFGLYRDGTELRGVYVADPVRARTVCASVGTDACDFPSLIGNDDFYGGLGGEFVITTRSPTSGTMALRHELGHNFGKVGEEYDGGQVYSGANSAPSIDSVSWKHWLTEPTKLVEQKAAQLYQKHIWHDLSQGAYTISFNSTGAYSRWHIKLSLSGADVDDAVVITLDGRPLAWTSNGLKDRSFYSWTSSSAGFSAGTHTLVVKGGGSFTGSIIKQLCNAVIYEYKDESEFKLDDRNYIGLYPTYDINKAKSYRPDNEKCLMRNMTSTSFCSVCIENMWLKFMARIEFIDDVVVSGKSVEVKLIPLGQLRLASDGFRTTNPALAAAEKYTIQWLRPSGEEAVELRDQVKVNVASADNVHCASDGTSSSRQWTVRVAFSTPSVRLDPNRFTQSKRSFQV